MNKRLMYRRKVYLSTYFCRASSHDSVRMRSKAMPWPEKDSNRSPRPYIRNHTTGSGLGEFGVLDIACGGVY